MTPCDHTQSCHNELTSSGHVCAVWISVTEQTLYFIDQLNESPIKVSERIKEHHFK